MFMCTRTMTIFLHLNLNSIITSNARNLTTVKSGAICFPYPLIQGLYAAIAQQGTSSPWCFNLAKLASFDTSLFPNTLAIALHRSIPPCSHLLAVRACLCNSQGSGSLCRLSQLCWGGYKSWEYDSALWAGVHQPARGFHTSTTPELKGFGVSLQCSLF